MKTIQGAFSLALRNKSRTREAPTPTNISTNSDPEMLKKGTAASPAMALASSVLPVPGWPINSTPLGMRAPMAVNFSGALEERNDFLQFFFGFFDTGYVVEHHAGFSFHLKSSLGAAKIHGVTRARRRATKDHQQAKNQNQRQQRVGG